MIELKVQCDCGQRYKFDVEPVNGRMPHAVGCPACGADGTAKANDLIRQSGHVGETIPVARLAAATPPPVAPIAAAVPAAPSPGGPPRLRINVAAPAAPAASGEAPPPLAPPPLTAPMPRQPVPGARQPAVAGAEAANKKAPSFWLGLTGGFLGVLIGSTIYALVFKYSAYHIGAIAIGVGFLGGLGGHLLGRGEGSKELGGITAILAVAGIIIAQYVVAIGWWHEGMREMEDAGYTASVIEAKEVVKAIPNGTDEEIRNYLAKVAAEEDDEKPRPAAVTKDDIKQFREKELPEMRDLASGKETRDQYLAKNQIDPKEMKKAADEGESTFKGIFLLLLLRKWNLVSMVAAAGLAYKMTANA